MKRILSLLFVLVMLFLAGCSPEASAPAVEINVSSVYAGFEKTLPDMIKMDADMMLNFCGIDAADCKEALVYVSADGLLADEIWLIEAKDEASLETLRQLAQTRIQSKLDETETYAPDQYLIVQQAVVLTQGRYLALFISPDVETLKASFEANFQ